MKKKDFKFCHDHFGMGGVDWNKVHILMFRRSIRREYYILVLTIVVRTNLSDSRSSPVYRLRRSDSYKSLRFIKVTIKQNPKVFDGGCYEL